MGRRHIPAKKRRAMWHVIDSSDGIRHVVPAENGHLLTAHCPCGPEDDGGIWVHSTFLESEHKHSPHVSDVGRTPTAH